MISVTGNLKEDGIIYTEDDFPVFQLQKFMTKNFKGKIKFAFQNLEMNQNEKGELKTSCYQV